jgi:RNA polymerase sigma-70 factor (ECF subfamily)
VNKEEKFINIVDENAERIMRICRYYNPNTEDQKDMYQEVLINIWKSLDNFRGESKISTWVYRIAINTSLSFTGKSFKQMKMMVSRDIQNMHVLLDDDLQNKIEFENNFEKLQTELNLLSVIDKAMISLVIEELSTREISNIIGITESNVRVKIHRLKEQLRNSLLKNDRVNHSTLNNSYEK